MANSNNEKGHSDCHILIFPGVRVSDGLESNKTENVDVEKSCGRRLIESQREAVKGYLRLPGTDPRDVIEDMEKYEIRIRTSRGEIPVLKFLNEILKNKRDLKLVGH